MTPTFLLFGVILCVGGLFIWVLYRVARTIPVAYAWNPETHDKLTSYAIDLLKREEPRPTLLGWICKTYERDAFLHNNLILQMRRGSIDEDMNSDLIVTLEPTWRWLDRNLHDATESLGDALEHETSPFLRNMGAFMLILASRAASDESISEWIARGIDSTLIKKVMGKDFDGTNGGYHFFNPVSGTGLSDPVQLAIMLQSAQKEGWMRGVSDPMPSAVHRALEKDTPSGWWMDREQRNYTLEDATRYYRSGYPHLGAYAAGRVVHLLQDMAVPAHVRDDAHFGLEETDPADPLEYFAAKQDWVKHFGLPVPKNEIVWGYDPQRNWNPANQGDHLSRGQGIYAERQDFLVKERSTGFKTFFTELALHTHSRQYSYGTIPGNADSHNPDMTRNPDGKPSIPWVPDNPPDFEKCRPSIGALVELFRLQGLIAGSLYSRALAIRNTGFQFQGVTRVDRPHEVQPVSREQRAKEFSRGSRAPVSSGPGRRGAPVYVPDTLTGEAGKRAIDKWMDNFEPLYPLSGKIDTLVRNHREREHEITGKVLIEIISITDEIDECLRRAKEVPFPPDLDGSTGNLKEENRTAIQRYKKDLDNLLVNYQSRQNALRKNLRFDELKKYLEASPVIEALTGWIRNHPDRKGLADAFNDTHGPCCLMNAWEDFAREGDLALITRQYDECESYAIGYSAAFLARWFESLYAPESGGGIALWKNDDPETGASPGRRAPDDPSSDGQIANGQEIAVDEGVFSLALAHSLPAVIELDITLCPLPDEEEADTSFTENLYPEGIPLRISLQVIEANRVTRRSETLTYAPLDGTPEKLPSAVLKPSCDPVVGSFPLPLKGGIRREEEEEKIIGTPPYPGRKGARNPDDGEKIAEALLRFEFGDTAEPGEPDPVTASAAGKIP